MVNVLASNAVDREFEPDQVKLFQLFHGENTSIVNEMLMRSALF
jgi:hypothetical protein